ncbi:methyltransferase [Ventosimonas gracilis]|uniref:Ribosomal RNA small subunit methyltransferase I n=1 Tax=Ventosimonas gracilis TaxID=1680762 RepID=A0A139SVJ7_9GAMM|nr:16S rRNA (cytidine(1402)-2'-O)-methyltransferase [Ventosimonas gracilis]KXU38617.1 methyltransferase [Ventosimonas gracilis]
MTGTLYVVATPIGNLEDISARALRVLREVSLIAAEDTRHSRKLLAHFAIDTPLMACHEHNERATSAHLLERLQQGQDLALISDAGTPLISDPGYPLVQQARAAGIAVVPIPGACALIAALSVSGLPADGFIFDGFLPSKTTARRARLEQLARQSQTLIFYEAPHRLLACLTDMTEVFGDDRPAVLARELTKTFETLISAPLARLQRQVTENTQQQRGECVLLVGGFKEDSADKALGSEALHLLDLLLQELSPAKAASLAAKISGQNKRLFYRAALERKNH